MAFKAVSVVVQTWRNPATGEIFVSKWNADDGALATYTGPAAGWVLIDTQSVIEQQIDYDHPFPDPIPPVVTATPAPGAGRGTPAVPSPPVGGCTTCTPVDGSGGAPSGGGSPPGGGGWPGGVVIPGTGAMPGTVTMPAPAATTTNIPWWLLILAAILLYLGSSK